MNKKISLIVSGSRFDIELEAAFADFLLTQMKEDLNLEGNNDVKVVLQAYVRKNYELFEQERNCRRLLQQIDESQKP